MAFAAILALSAVARSSTATMAPVQFEGRIDPDAESELMRDHIVAYRLDGALFFGASQRFLTELTAVSDVRVVILRLPDVQVLDATGARALGEIVAELESRGITVLLKGPRREHLRILGVVGALDRLAHENHVFQRLDDAVAHAHEHALRTEHARLSEAAATDAA
jgi:SulP family sulfate permease